MKKLFLILFLLFFGLSMRAEIKLVIWGNDGSQVAFALNEEPQLYFHEDYTMTVSTLNSSQTFKLSDIRKYTFEGLDDAGYRNLEDDRGSSFKFDGELLLFPALKAGSTVTIHAVGGAVVMSKAIETAGDYSFPISHLDKGVYLVSVDGLTYKIVKK
jgi:hypothetical protein